MDHVLENKFLNKEQAYKKAYKENDDDLQVENYSETGLGKEEV